MKLTLFHTSDEHGHIRNAPAIQQQVDASRADHPTLLVSTGDTFEGSATSTLLGVQPAVDVLRAAGYDAIALGNHDFDRGSQVTRQWVKDAGCPVVAANVEEASGGLLQGVRPYQVFEKDGVRVGLIGVTTQETANIAYGDSLKDVRFSDPVAAVQKYSAELREQGVEVVGVLSHLGLGEDRKLAASVTGVDFILGGHTHDRTDVEERVNGVVIGHPGSFREAVGRLDVEVSDGRVASVQYRAEKVASFAAAADGPVGDIVARYEKAMEGPLEERVALLHRHFTHDDVEVDDLEEVVTRAMRDTAKADVAIINQKFMRTDLRPGELKRRDTLTALPFDNRVQTVKMKVGEIARIMRESMRRNDQTSLAMFGVKLTQYQGGAHTVTLHGSDVQLSDEQELTVAMTDYLLSGGLGYLGSDLRGVAQDHGLVREVVEKRLADESFISTLPSGGTLSLQFHGDTI